MPLAIGAAAAVVADERARDHALAFIDEAADMTGALADAAERARALAVVAEAAAATGDRSRVRGLLDEAAQATLAVLDSQPCEPLS